MQHFYRHILLFASGSTPFSGLQHGTAECQPETTAWRLSGAAAACTEQAASIPAGKCAQHKHMNCPAWLLLKLLLLPVGVGCHNMQWCCLACTKYYSSNLQSQHAFVTNMCTAVTAVQFGVGI